METEKRRPARCTKCGSKVVKNEQFMDCVCLNCGAVHQLDGTFIGYTFFISKEQKEQLENLSAAVVQEK